MPSEPLRLSEANLIAFSMFGLMRIEMVIYTIASTISELALMRNTVA
jgi:hypothetical protein